MGSCRLLMTDSTIPYRSWKNKLLIRALVYGVDKKDQGIVLL